MTLERLVEEIRRQAEADLKAETDRQDAERTRIAADRDHRIEEIRAEAKRSGEREAAREHAQKVAGARMAVRKMAYEARERQVGDALVQSRKLLSDYTDDSEYPAVLKRMYAAAVEQLGKSIKVYGRAEDASVLRSVAGKSFDDTAAPILGGLIAETADGERRLNLSFDELLRRREDQLRDLLAK